MMNYAKAVGGAILAAYIACTGCAGGNQAVKQDQASKYTTAIVESSDAYVQDVNRTKDFYTKQIEIAAKEQEVKTEQALEEREELTDKVNKSAAAKSKKMKKILGEMDQAFKSIDIFNE